jgi:hypothetical protein
VSVLESKKAQFKAAELAKVVATPYHKILNCNKLRLFQFIKFFNANIGNFGNLGQIYGS